MDSDGSDTEDLTQDQLDTRVSTQELSEERIWEEGKVDVPLELLKGIEAGWQEAKQEMRAAPASGAYGGAHMIGVSHAVDE